MSPPRWFLSLLVPALLSFAGTSWAQPAQQYVVINVELSVVDINALRALAPPSLRRRSQAVRPPGPHAAAPLEPQAQEGYHATFAGVRVSGAEGLRREIQRRDRDAG
jgi:hypothetical protein